MGNLTKGVVQFFDARKGFGKIKINDDSNADVFVHFSEVQNFAKVLLEGEEVEFEIENRAKGSNAINLRRLLDRNVGIIEHFEHGFGFIKALGSDEKYFAHHSEFLGRNGYKKIEAGFEVEFSVAVSDKGLQARNIIIRDSRTALEKFSQFKDWDSAIKDLAENHAQNEDGNWDYITQKTGGLPVLESYITYTFARLLKEDKIKYATATEKGKELKFSCFNTGLATSKQEDIFAYFEHKDNFNYSKQNEGYLTQPVWIFKCFDRESNRTMNNFAHKPELANYFQNAVELIYESSRRLIPDFEHILDDREKRFPQAFRELSKAQQVERINSAITSALTRVRRNYKTAIPQFYDDSIQLLLPLCITTAEKTDVALVVAREGEVYRANTILPLDWAYNNARLLAKPDREWLNP